jgi:outer membrane immunogenic protein
MRKFVIAVAALAFTGTAYAADMPLLKAPPMMAAPPSWTGFYLGVNGGGASGGTETGLNVTPAGLYNATAVTEFGILGSNSIRNSGGLAGGQIGYLLQQGSVVGGFEASFDWFKAKGGVVSSATTPLPFVVTENASSSWLALFLARAGVDMGAWFPYVTGGLAVASLQYTGSHVDTSGTPTNSAISLSQAKLGYAGGAGLEYRFDNHWSLRGEYLFVQFNGLNGSVQAFQTPTGLPVTGASMNYSAQYHENIGRAAVSYKF